MKVKLAPAFCVISLLAAPWPAGAVAQDVSEPALKAAFLYNFARFTEWPSGQLAPGAPLYICVADSVVAGELESMASDKTIGDHKLILRRVSIDDQSSSRRLRNLHLGWCHVLYLGRLDLRSTVVGLGRTAGSSVLTVGDGEEFTKMGGVARFFVDRGRLRFEISTASARRANIQFSAKLLQLAQIVKD